MKSWKGRYCNHRFANKEEMVAHMMKMRNDGYNNSAIAEEMNIAYQTVYGYIGKEPKAIRSFNMSATANDTWFRKKYRDLLSTADKSALINMKHKMELKKKAAEKDIHEMEQDSKFSKYLAKMRDIKKCDDMINTINMFVDTK